MILKYNLQFFADGPGGEKTEPATEKKLRDARKEGQVAKSKEIANGMVILALFLILKLWVGTMGEQFLEIFSGAYGKIPETVKNYNGLVPEDDLVKLLFFGMVQIGIIVAPILLVGMLVAFLCEVAQVKWEPTGKTLKPKFSKLNPIKGFKKIISASSLVELVKSIAKILLIVYISYSYLKEKSNLIFLLYDMPLMQVISLLGEIVTDLGIRIALVYMIWAFAE